MNNIVIYARKSSEAEDRQALSIDSQITELTALAGKQKLVISSTLTESASAKKPGRPIFNEMIDTIEKGSIDSIVVWNPDRLARNSVDSGRLIYLFDQGKLKSIVTPYQSFTNTPNDKFLLQILWGQAKLENDNKSLNVIRGLKTKAEQGWYPVVAPLGYLNTPDRDKGFKIVVKDKKRFAQVRQMWDLMLTGNYTPNEIREIANNEWGFLTRQFRKQGGKPISRSLIYKIFVSPFYYGWFEYNGELTKGKHEAMVTEVEFDKVQQMLGRKGVKRPQKHEFPYSGMIRCGECGAMVTGSKKTKYYPLTKRLCHYTYYRCTHHKTDKPCKQSPVTSSIIDNQIDEILSKIQISEKFKDWALTYLHEVHDQEVNSRSQIWDNLQDQYSQVQKQLDNLLDLRIKGLLTDDEYKSKKQNLQKAKSQLNEKINDTDHRADQWLELSEKTFEMAYYARYWFTNGDIEKRRSILNAIGSNFSLINGNITIDLQKPFFILKDSKENEKKYSLAFELPKKIELSEQTRLLAIKNPSWLPR